jgi:hypothetical protein
MLRIHPQSYDDFFEWCNVLGVTDLPVPSTRKPVPDDAPWLDAPYRDLPLDYLERLLSWEGIGKESLVAGLPSIDHPRRHRTHESHELLIFPIRGFLEHVTALEPATFERALAAGSLREYNSNTAPLDEQLTDEQHLALVIAEVADFCLANDFVLSIQY